MLTKINHMKIQVSEPKFWGNEKLYVNDCLDTNWISSGGKYLEQFESAFCKFTNRKFAVSVSNGTAALEVAAYGIGIEPGDEVIMPSFTIISCAAAIIRLGGVPVFVDVEEDTWNINPEKIESAITENTKAIMMVHIYGHPADYNKIREIADKHELKIIEDSAEAHGAKIDDEVCGSLGDVSTFSFYANKLITTGEGGMVLTNDVDIHSRMSAYRNLCFIDGDRFHHEDMGFNYRMTNIQAAIGLGQIEQIDKIIKKKRDIGKYYLNKLNQINGLKLQVERDNCFTTYWMYCVQLKSGEIDAKTVMNLLKKEGIDTRPFFKGLHLQPALNGHSRSVGAFPVTENAYNYGFYLPSGMEMTEDKVDYVVEKLKSVLITLGYMNNS